MKTYRSIALLTAIATALVASIATAANEPAKPDAKKVAAPAVAKVDHVITLTAKEKLPKSVSQVTIIDRVIGDKATDPVGPDSAVLVNYTGWLYDPKKPDGKGEKFDSSYTRQLPYSFFLNSGKVIKGWDLGVAGMKVKGIRTLIIPPSLAYRDVAKPNIPANSTLLFEIELIDILGQRDVSVGSAGSAAPVVPVVTVPIARLEPAAALPAAPVALTLIDELVGDGATAETTSDVRVHYTGWLYDATQPGGKKGKHFDSSRDRNQVFPLKLGTGRVIKGWDHGLVGMKVKGKRTLIIPAEFGYGARGAGQGLIPPNATLIFDVELIDIAVPPAAPVPTPAPTPVPATAPATK